MMQQIARDGGRGTGYAMAGFVAMAFAVVILGADLRVLAFGD